MAPSTQVESCRCDHAAFGMRKRSAGRMWSYTKLKPNPVLVYRPQTRYGDSRRANLVITAANSPASANPGTSYNEHKPKTPPPDLPSLLLDSRIVYIGMPVRQASENSTFTYKTQQLVPAVTELIVSELLYLQYTDQNKPCYIYINSTGCTRADGEVVGFETEATAIYDTMKYIGNEVRWLELSWNLHLIDMQIDLHCRYGRCHRPSVHASVSRWQREAIHDSACDSYVTPTTSAIDWRTASDRNKH